jgi:hypothetical protein
LRRQKIGVLVVRGGLGNQLYQISALAYYSKLKGFLPLIYDKDLFLSARDNFSAQYQNVNVASWFDEKHPMLLEGFASNFFRYFLIITRRLKLFKPLSEIELQKFPSLPRIFLIQGSFQNKLYPLSLSPNVLTLNSFALQPPNQKVHSDSRRIAIHIRLTDFLPANPFNQNYYSKSIENIDPDRNYFLDVYTDDIALARELLGKFSSRDFNFPEANRAFKPIELLFAIATYDKIVASKSSICWWACLLAKYRNPLVEIIHPWDAIEDFT